MKRGARASILATVLFQCLVANDVYAANGVPGSSSPEVDEAIVRGVAALIRRAPCGERDAKEAELLEGIPEDMHSEVRSRLDTEAEAIESGGTCCSSHGGTCCKNASRSTPRRRGALDEDILAAVSSSSSLSAAPGNGDASESHDDGSSNDSTADGTHTHHGNTNTCGCSDAPTSNKNVASAPGDGKCPSSDTCGMSAYFENTYESVILFDFWRTSTSTEYFISLVLIFFLSLFTVGLKAVRKKVTSAMLSGTGAYTHALKHLPLAVISFLVSLMDFSMMLVAMTFNVGIVLVLSAGYAVGYVLTCYTLALVDGTVEIESAVECDADCC